MALWVLLVVLSCNVNIVTYLYHQAKGQLSILINGQTFEEYTGQNQITGRQAANLKLINDIKTYSVDSLFFKPTSNFTKIYNQKNSNILWAISASEKYRISPYYWSFPVVGKVSYKGFFEKEKAEAEKNRLVCLGYDVDLRSVSAWSTLGWFSDPVLSNMLDKTKGSLCNLIFHELFHATYYAPGSVDYNENLASFIAHKATLMYLRNDTAELNRYTKTYNDNRIIDKKITVIVNELIRFYSEISAKSETEKLILKLKKLNSVYVQLDVLPVISAAKIKTIKKQISVSKNAWFVDFEQYNSLQDSLEEIFNKNYKSSLPKMVQSLK